MGKAPGASWSTIEPEEQFEGTTLGKRAKKRLDDVSLIGKKRWRVLGNRKLGDAYPEYIVRLPEGEKKYDCDCYHHAQGQYRRRKMCSHVMAVVMWRKTEAGKTSKFTYEEPEQIEDTVVTIEPLVDEGPRVEQVQPKGDDDAPGRRWAVLDSDKIPDISDPIFGKVAFPPKFKEFREHQWQAVTEIMDHLEAGVKVVMLSAPTGSGKTLIGEAVNRLVPGFSVYCCTTKSLQDQIAEDFPYAAVIKGKSNYPTTFRADLSADDCTGTSQNQYQCDWCPSRNECEYQVAKEVAAGSSLPVLNIAYFLAETSASRGSRFLGRPLVIIDEADTIEDQLMGSVEVVLGARLRKSIGVYSLPKKTVPSDWVMWLENEVLPGINSRIYSLKSEGRTLMGVDTEKMKQAKRLELLRQKIKKMLGTTPEGTRVLEEGWVMTGYEGTKNESEATVRFKPIRVDEHARQELWDRGKQFLLMSATLISPEQMADDFGLEDHEWEVVHVESMFPIENRPVFIEAVASMTNKTKAEAWPIMAKEIGTMLDENPGVRVLVHTVSYHLTKYLHENILCNRPSTSIMSYSDARSRERVLQKFLDQDDAVLLAPSFERGIDLPEEDCEIIIIAKVPYPYLGDKQINARMRSKGGQSWYAVQTIRAIAQMTGRGMRSADDWCDTYIMDTQFKRLYRENKRLFPKWWRESVVTSKTDPRGRILVKAARARKEARE